MSRKNEMPVLILSLLVTAGLLGAGVWWFTQQAGTDIRSLVLPSPNQSSSPTTLGRLEDRLSLGSKILITAATNPDKQAGVQAFAASDFSTAIAKFEASLQANRNDPEALIYLNNARIGSNQAFKIVVSAPIGGNVNVAQEILRGVAQAQAEVNQSGGIQGTPLQIQIANDDNSPDVAKQLASEFVKDSSILAVVGHNSSNASINAAPVYQQGGLVMISPTSRAKKLSGIGSYIFRTVPSIRFDADTLSRYALKTARTSTIAICADPQAEASQSLQEEFTSAVFADGGKITRTNCNFSAPDFNPSTAVSQAISDGADALLIVPAVDKVNQGVDVARANKGRLVLLSDSTMYTFKTLQLGQADVRGLVLTAPWHPAAVPGNPFADNANKLWGGSVNWRSAMAYDAVQAIVMGLKQSSSRSGLQKALANSSFATNGAAGTIQFLASGDRNLPSTLVQVQAGKRSGTGYDFVPLQP